MELKVTLSVEGSGEGSVVQGSGQGPGARVWGHPADAVLGLIWREFSPQLICQNIRLCKTQ